MSGYVEKRKLLLSERIPGRMQDVYESAEVISLFADGIARVLSGSANTKLEFFRTTNVIVQEKGEPIEEREVFLRLTIPTAVYLESIGNVLASMGQNITLIQETNNKVVDAIKQTVKQAQNVKL